MPPLVSPAEGAVDSRQYRFSFPIEALWQVPADCVLPADVDALDAGVFLPRADADWLGRRAYPARILLLTSAEVLVVAYATAAEQAVRIAPHRIQRVEWGRMLLAGWIILDWDGGKMLLRYNTRARGPVEKCMQTILDRWLPATQAGQTGSAAAFGAPLNLKFENARAGQPLPGESFLVQFFQPGVHRARRRWCLRRDEWRAGDLAAVTSRRLLWITERHKGNYQRYGTVSHSAALASFDGAQCVRTERGCHLEIAFHSGEPWQIPLGEELEREARGFEAAVRALR